MDASDSDLIDKIQWIRSRNNSAWMNLVRLALDVAPDRARVLFAEISKNDREILELSERLARDPHGGAGEDER